MKIRADEVTIEIGGEELTATYWFLDEPGIICGIDCLHDKAGLDVTTHYNHDDVIKQIGPFYTDDEILTGNE